MYLKVLRLGHLLQNSQRARGQHQTAEVQAAWLAGSLQSAP